MELVQNLLIGIVQGAVFQVQNNAQTKVKAKAFQLKVFSIYCNGGWWRDGKIPYY